MADAISVLKDELQQAEERVAALRSAIETLGGGKSGGGWKGRRRMSAATRAKISAAAKARWAKAKK